jgi:hypothetical protein
MAKDSWFRSFYLPIGAAPCQKQHGLAGDSGTSAKQIKALIVFAGVIRSWLSGKTLDRDFTFTGDKIMTYMPARGPWFDTRKPHLVTLVRWQKGA